MNRTAWVSVALVVSVLTISGCAVAPKPPVRFIPVAYCPRTTAAPSIDGVLDDACWAQAGTMTDFVSDKRDELPTQGTLVRVARDDKWIYFAARCAEADMARAKVHRTGRTLPWDEDSIEVFLDVERGDSSYAHFGGNVLGANNFPLPKDTPDAVVVRGVSGRDEWTLEARMLIEAVTETPPADGEVWGININRNRFRPKGTEYSNWSRLKGSSHQVDIFGQLVFCDKLPAVRVRSIHLPGRYAGENVALLGLTGPAGGAASAVIETGESSQTRQVRLGKAGSASVGVPYRLRPGAGAVKLTVSAGEQTLLASRFRISQTNARPAWSKYVPGRGSFALATPREVVRQGEQLTAEIDAMLDGAGAALPRVQWRLELPGAKPIEGTGPLLKARLAPALPDGEGMLTARLTDPAGKLLARLQRKVTLAGTELARWERLSGEFVTRLDAAEAAQKDPELLRYLAKTRVKVKRLGYFTRMRRLAEGRGATADLAHHVESIEKGALPGWGHHECAYTSDIDGTQQPYAVAIPPGYRPEGADRLPVLIWLHCYWGDGKWDPEHIKVYMDAMERACLKKGFILVHPYGRGSQWYAHDGEADVWDVWKAVNKRWRIDPDRVYLAGFSMGGGGTGRLAAAYPQLFAAAAMYSGGVDADKAGNLKYLPLRLEAGGQEPASQWMAKLAEQIKKVPGRTAETIYVAHPNEGHTRKYIDFDALLDWFGRYRRVADPAAVSYATDGLRHHSGYWVTVDRIAEHGKIAKIDARIDAGVLKVTTSNVAAATLRPPAGLLKAGRAPKVVLNGKTLRGVKLETGAIRLSIGAAAPVGKVRKTKARPGPIRDAFTGPLMLVATDSGEANLKAAEIITKRWRRWHHGELAVVTEAKVSKADLAARSVILVGPWTQKGLMGQVARTGPVKIGPAGITVSGKTTKGADQGIIFVQPSPVSSLRYVVVLTGQSPAGVLAACKMFSQGRYGGDYALAGKGPSGVFDEQWK